MKLYSGPVSLFTAKVRIALAEKALDYERIEVGWSREHAYEPHHPDVVALNPKRQVPVLVDGDLTLCDSTLILDYLEERNPEPPLYPRDLRERARARQLEAAADEILFPHIWVLIGDVIYPAGSEGRDAQASAAAKQALAEHHAQLDALLAGRDHLCGAFGVADIASFIMLSAGVTLGAPPDPGLTHLSGWLARVGTRPSVAREMNDMAQVVAKALSQAAA